MNVIQAGAAVSSSSPKIKARVRVRSVLIAQTIDVAAAYTLFSNESASIKLVPVHIKIHRNGQNES